MFLIIIVQLDALASDQDNVIYVCRACRFRLFDSSSVVAHEPGEGQTSFTWTKRVKVRMLLK